jgi:hypothetical protein
MNEVKTFGVQNAPEREDVRGELQELADEEQPTPALVHARPDVRER